MISMFIVGYYVSGCLVNNNWKHDAITHGFADYNPTNGVWEWKGKEGGK